MQCSLIASVRFQLKTYPNRLSWHPSIPSWSTSTHWWISTIKWKLRTRSSYLKNASKISNRKQNIFPDIIRPISVVSITWSQLMETSVHLATERLHNVCPAKIVLAKAFPCLTPRSPAPTKNMDESHRLSDFFNNLFERNFGLQRRIAN